MTFRKTAPTILVLSVIASMIALLAVQTRISDQLVATYDTGEFSLIGDITATAFRHAQATALMEAETIASNPDVQKAFVAGDRAALLSLTQDDFAVLHERHGISQAQFHVAPATSFLRLHKPEDFGDDQSDFRFMVVDAMKTASPRQGVEITRAGVDIFATVPVFNPEHKVAGSFEVGVELEGILDDIKMDHQLEVAVYINEEKLRTIATKERPEVFSESNRLGSFLRVYATHPALIKELVTADDVSVAEDAHYIRDVAGKSYGVMLQPIFNQAHVQIGVIAAVKEFTEDRIAFKTAFIYEALASISISIFLIALVLLVLNGMILRPLDVLRNRLKAYSEGQDLPEEKLELKARWAHEISDVIRYTDALERRLDQKNEAGHD
jgi:methyl-accepting chemotaxis protein